MNTIRNPANHRERIPLTPELVQELIHTARTKPAYSSSYHCQSMADALEALSKQSKEVIVTQEPELSPVSPYHYLVYRGPMRTANAQFDIGMHKPTGGLYSNKLSLALLSLLSLIFVLCRTLG
mgnify:CR=1 FL=1